jgi:putative membrane protein
LGEGGGGTLPDTGDILMSLDSGNAIAVSHGMYFRSKKDKVYQGLIAGAVGGLAGSWVMTRFQFLLTRALGHTDPHEGQGEDATVKTAQKISSELLDHDLSAEDKKKAGPIVHYAYGTGIGAFYGALAQRHENTTSGFGTAYGAAAWALGDEMAVPALGLGKKPTETPASQHFQTLAAHLVYGITLEGVRRLALKAL